MNKLANIFVILLLIALPSLAITKYPYGTMPSVSEEARLAAAQAAYADWYAKYVTAEGCPAGALRVHRAGAFQYDTVSEGIAWGMLIVVLLDSPAAPGQANFDAFWQYQKAYLNNQGLMAWKIDRYGQTLETESATEADENSALALLYADKKWGSQGKINYLAEAKTLIQNIMSAEVEKETFVLKPGANWGGTEVTNPMYYDPAYYRLWIKFDPNWQKLVDRSYQLYDYFYGKYPTGLYPDWCRADGSRSFLGYNFSYDACQVPLKIGLDYLWYGAGKKYLARLNDWLIVQTGSWPKNIFDGYALEGKRIGWHRNAAFIGPLCVAAMSSDKDQVWLDNMYGYLVKMRTGGRWGYYGDTLRLVSLIILSGQMPAP